MEEERTIEKKENNLPTYIENVEDAEEDFFRILGFKDKKEFNSYNSKARSIWKSKQRKIIYEDELSKEELGIIKKDITLSKLAKQRVDTETAIVFRVNELLKKSRNIKE